MRKITFDTVQSFIKSFVTNISIFLVNEIAQFVRPQKKPIAWS